MFKAVIVFSFFFSELNQFFEVLDKRAEEQRKQCKHYAAERKRRRSGILVATTPPCNAPKWTVDKEWRKGNPFVLVKNEKVKFIFITQAKKLIMSNFC